MVEKCSSATLTLLDSPQATWKKLGKLANVYANIQKSAKHYIRGGISTITKRFAKANNENIAGHDPDSEQIHLLYIDGNNLDGNLISSDNRLTVTLLNYSIYTLCIIQSFLKFYILYFSRWAMSQYLPTHGFRWLNQDEIDTISTRIQNLEDQDEYGYIFEVDLQYPHHLHHTHSLLNIWK